jgi:hypothetical protein
MESILSYADFSKQRVNEADEKPKDKESAAAPKEDAVDTSGGTLKDMTIDGKEYAAVLTTYKAIASKQAAMGVDAVGMITLPGSEKVWELYDKKDVKK